MRPPVRKLTAPDDRLRTALGVDTDQLVADHIDHQDRAARRSKGLQVLAA